MSIVCILYGYIVISAEKKKLKNGQTRSELGNTVSKYLLIHDIHYIILLIQFI